MLLRLCYQNQNGEMVQLPSWANFYISLGRLLKQTSPSSSRIVIAMAVPSRSFAAAFVMLGAVWEAQSSDRITERLIQEIQKLAEGTPIQVSSSSTKVIRGTVAGFATRNNKVEIIVQTSKSTKKTRRFPLESFADKIRVIAQEAKLPEGDQTGRQIPHPSKFLKCVLDPQVLERHVQTSSLEVVMIGNLSSLQREICETPFYCGNNTSRLMHEGVLQEILQVGQFSAKNQAHKSECIASSKLESEGQLGNRSIEPELVVLEGSIAYLKQGHLWTNSHQIVILDRTERQFADACHVINSNYAHRLDEGFELDFAIPSNIEIMIYREKLNQ